MTMTDEEMSQRERRRQQFQENKPKVAFNAAALKKWAWPLGIVLVVGGIVTAMVVTDNAQDDCPVHWHAAYTVYIDGERVRYTNPSFGSADNTYAAGTHIHNDDGVYHFHPAVQKCTDWRDALRHLGTAVGSSSLTLDSQHGAMAGTYDAAPVRVFEQKWSEQDDQWLEVTKFGNVLDQQPGNGDGLVIIYGDHTDEEIATLLEQAFSLNGNPTYDPHFEAA